VSTLQEKCNVEKVDYRFKKVEYRKVQC